MSVLLKRLQAFPMGYSVVWYLNKKYGVTRTDFNGGKSIKIYAEELGGNDFISLNYYVTNRLERLRPCEMPESKVIDFINGAVPAQDKQEGVQWVINKIEPIASKGYFNTKNIKMSDLKKAYIAGGCFWGMEDLFRVRPGVKDTEVGYIGGDNENPTYRNHPGHAEGMEITYDPAETSFKKLLDFFFRIHDPTTVNRQGNDVGSSYRSTVFFQNEEEKSETEEVIKLVNDSKSWKGQVATTLEPYSTFWAAEPEHQDYLVRNPNGYTCHFERSIGSFL